VPRVLIIYVKRAAKSGSFYTSMHCISLRTKNISADQICANWLIFAFLELENAQASSVCCRAYNIVTLIHVFGVFSF